MVIHTEDIRRVAAHTAEELPVDQIRQEGLMEIPLKEVLVIPDRHLQCQEPPAIVPEEVRGPGVQLVIEVQGQEAPVAIEVQDLEVPEVHLAIEVQGVLQDLLAA